MAHPSTQEVYKREKKKKNKQTNYKFVKNENMKTIFSSHLLEKGIKEKGI